MSIALDRGSSDTRTIQRSQVIHDMSCHPSPASRAFPDDRRFPVTEVEKSGEETDSSSLSSIGGNSDLSSGASSDGDDSGETEVQSSFKGGPLDTMNVLEEVLPIGRGLSKHYCGKSKSYTSLSDAVSSPSIKDIVKPVNPYNKKRKNELAYSNIWNKGHNHPPRSNSCGVLKRVANAANQSTLALRVNESSIESKSNSEDFNSISLSPPCFLPPLHPQSKRSPINGSSSPSRQNNLPCRSFSLSDLQCFAPETPCITGLVINNTNGDNYLN